MKQQSDKFSVSIIIPTYNRCDLLNYTLTSLVRQTIEKNKFEVIVADDGSSDNTRELVLSYQDRLNIKYAFQEDKGYRPASARNMGIELSEGTICVFIDSGVILDDHCLEEHIGFYAKRGRRNAIVGYVYGFDRTKESEEMVKGMVVPERPGESIRRLATNSVFFDVREEHYFMYTDRLEDLPAPWYYFWTCHVSALREDLLAVGMFDEAFDGRWGVEDNELGFRLHQSGVKIHLLRTAKAIHYPHQKDKTERERQGYQNCIYFNSKHQAPEISIFLENYLVNWEFFDLNKKIMQTKRRLQEEMAISPNGQI